MYLDECVYYGKKHGDKLWGRYAKRVYQVEKKIFSSGCIENMDFAQRVLKQLGSDYGRRYLLTCRYLNNDELFFVAKAFNIELPFSLEKPLEKIVYETSTSGTMYPFVAGYLLCDDGGLYKFDGKCNWNGQYKNMKYELMGKNKGLSSEVKNFIIENYYEIEKLPSEANNLNLDDGGSLHYRFLDKVCDGYEMYSAENGKDIIEWGNKVESIIKKHGINLNPSYSDSVKKFLHKYLGILDEIDFDKSFEKGYDFLDSTEFGDSCVRFGFDFLDGDIRWFIDDVGPCSFDELEDKQFLGSIIRSVWTYHKNAKNKSEARFNTDWFRWAFARLEKLLKKETCI